MNTRKHKFTVMMSVFLVFLERAHAEDEWIDMPIDPRNRTLTVCFVDGQKVTRAIYSNSDIVTRISVPGGYAGSYGARQLPDHVVVSNATQHVDIRAKPGQQPDLLGQVVVTVDRGTEVAFRVFKGQPDEVFDFIEIKKCDTAEPGPPEDLLTLMLSLDRRQRVLDQREKALDQRERNIGFEVEREVDRRTQDDLLQGRKVIRLKDKAPPDGRLQVRGLYIIEQGSERHLVFEAKNPGDEPLAVAQLKIYDGRSGRDHTGRWTIKAPAPTSGKARAVIEPYQHVKGIVQLVSPELMSKTVMMMIYEPDPNYRPPVIRNGIPVFDLTPPPDENEDMKTVSLLGIYGVTWLVNPLDDKALDPTTIKGLGARLNYGLTRRVNLEIEGIGASTGEACFEGVTYQGMTGDLVRSGWIGRVQGGLMARFGESWYRPVLRVGLGVQGTSSETQLDANGTRTPGPEVPFDIDGLWYIGAGLDIRLGQFAAGLGLSFNRLVGGGDTRSLQAAGHLDYSWK